MSELIKKRLATLSVGTRVSLNFRGGTTGYDTAEGMIKENNFIDGLAIETPAGEDVLVAYETVTSLRIPKAADRAAAPEKAVFLPVTPIPAADSPIPIPVTPIPAADLTVPVPVSPSTAAVSPVDAQAAESGADQPSESRNPRVSAPAVELPSLNDRELKDLFNRLPKKDRKRLNGSFDSFKYGVKCRDREKMASAADAAFHILLDGYEKGYSWDRSASRFCGTLYCRAGRPSADAYLPGKWYWEAACCALHGEDYVTAGACTVLALLEPEWRRGGDLISILIYCASAAGDCSGVRLLWERIPERI
ncbi:MAG: hypothetical protein IJT94_14565, partial [Oscillibacter sp.]|nr:hypothetical protein [Oscillibacter sp.]